MWEPSGILSKYVLKMPTILYGKNAVRGLKTFPSSRVAVIHGESLDEHRKNKLQTLLANSNVAFFLRSWKSEPSLGELKETLREIEEYKPDVFIAYGGGSVIDGVKMVRTFYEFPYFENKNRNNSLLSFSSKFIVIPTTIGSGAEVSSASVLFNEQTQSKEFVVSTSFIPDIIVLDPGIICESPKKLLYLSLIDAYSHIVEGFVSKINNPIVDVYAEKALQLINDNYQELQKDVIPENAALSLQFASLLAGIVQNHCIVGGAHGLAHQLSRYGFSHAAAIGIVLKEVIKYNANYPEVENKYQILASRANIAGGINGILNLLEQFKEKAEVSNDINRLHSFKDVLFNNSDFFTQAIEDLGAKGNPVTLDECAYKKILDAVI